MTETPVQVQIDSPRRISDSELLPLKTYSASDSLQDTPQQARNRIESAVWNPRALRSPTRHLIEAQSTEAIVGFINYTFRRSRIIFTAHLGPAIVSQCCQINPPGNSTMMMINNQLAYILAWYIQCKSQ